MEVEKEICILPQSKWNSMNDWLTERQREEERRKRKEAYLKHMKQMSSDLVAGNASKREEAARRLEERRKKFEGEDKKILEEYLQIKENQKKEREQMMNKYYRQNIFNKTPTIELTSALKAAQTLSERQNDVELRKKLRLKEKEMEEKERNELKRQWEVTDILHRREQEYRKCKLDATKTEVWKQCQDNLRRKNEEYSNRVKQERIEIWRTKEELDAIEKSKKEQQQIHRRKTFAILKRAVEEAQRQRSMEKKKDQELYKVNEVINNALTVRNCQIKSKMKEEVKDRLEQNIDLYVKYVSQLPAVEPWEEVIYQNGVRESQEMYEKKMAEERALTKKYAEAKILDYKEDMKRQQLKQEEEDELKRMEMIERYKKIEAMKYLDEVNQMNEMKQKKQYGEELLRQAEEQKNIRKLEKKLEDDFMCSTYAKQNDGFVEYAEEVLKFAQEKNWPTLPIRKAIENYKNKHPMIQRRRKSSKMSMSNLTPDEERTLPNLERTI